MTFEIGPLSTTIDAPPELVYQMLSAIGQGAARDGERAEVLDQDGNELTCDFWTGVRLPGGFERLVRTRERVTLRPPDAIDYEHLDGQLRGMQETITVAPIPAGGTRMTYTGSYELKGLLDSLRIRAIVTPILRRVIRRHFDDVRVRAEARAARSRVFPARPSVSPSE